MKKSLWIALFCLMAGFIAAEGAPKPGTVRAQAGLGLYWGGVAELQAGADVALARVIFTKEFPLDFGAAGRLSIGFSHLALGAYATATYGFEALSTGVAWLGDTSLSLGLGTQIIPNLGIDGYLAVRYRFAPAWGVYLEGSGWGSILGLSYQF